MGLGLVDLTRWPREPASPAAVDGERFAHALQQLCGRGPPARRRVYADWMRAAAAAFDVDPFLLGAIAYRHSRCEERPRAPLGPGLMGLHATAHAPFLRDGAYRYHVREEGAWIPRALTVPVARFTARAAREPESAIWLSAALLRVLRDQCPDLDVPFGSAPHRHYVSHFVWGDRVQGAGAEDLILQARRRLLEAYHGRSGLPLGRFGEVPLHSPVDGVPRKAMSGVGDPRDGGRRRHRGIDISGTTGEPVRAVADGVILFAGLDLKKGKSVDLGPGGVAAALRQYRHRIGAGGLFVMVVHGEGLVSAYMHLDTLAVRKGQQVRAGDLIGTIGRTGVKASDDHLHFELRHEGRHVDPFPHLAAYLFEPTATWLGRRMAETRRGRVRRGPATSRSGVHSGPAGPR